MAVQLATVEELHMLRQQLQTFNPIYAKDVYSLQGYIHRANSYKHHIQSVVRLGLPLASLLQAHLEGRGTKFGQGKWGWFNYMIDHILHVTLQCS